MDEIARPRYWERFCSPQHVWHQEMRPEAVQVARNSVCLRGHRKLDRLPDYLDNSVIRHTRSANEYEDQGDVVYRNALSSIFRNVDDQLRFLSGRAFWIDLESTLDACKHVANAVQNVIVKNGTASCLLRYCFRSNIEFINGFHDTASTLLQPRRIVYREALPLRTAIYHVGYHELLAHLWARRSLWHRVGHSWYSAPTLRYFAALIVSCLGPLAWWFSIPSSSSHALIGSLIGAAIVFLPAARAIFCGRCYRRLLFLCLLRLLLVWPWWEAAHEKRTKTRCA